MKIFYPIIAINRAGQTVILDTVEEVRSFISGKKVGAEWSAMIWTWGWDWRSKQYRYGRFGDIEQNEWILRDDRGNAIDPREEPIRVISPYVRYARQRAAAEKGLPIPGTGKGRSRRRRFRGCRCSYCERNVKARNLDHLSHVDANAAENDFNL